MQTDNIARRVGILRWEADVTLGRITYTFVAFTKNGAAQKAATFLILSAKDQS